MKISSDYFAPLGRLAIGVLLCEAYMARAWQRTIVAIKPLLFHAAS